MVYKRRMIAMILAVFLFAIATASASDVSDTAIASEDHSQMELAVNDEIIGDFIDFHKNCYF